MSSGNRFLRNVFIVSAIVFGVIALAGVALVYLGGMPWVFIPAALLSFSVSNGIHTFFHWWFIWRG